MLLLNWCDGDLKKCFDAEYFNGFGFQFYQIARQGPCLYLGRLFRFDENRLMQILDSAGYNR